MKCFRHSDADAVAICKCCAKGVCPVCAIEIHQGVACSEGCAETAKETSEFIRASVAARKLNTKGGGAYFQPAFLTLLGAAFMATPLLTGHSSRADNFSFVTGGLMLGFGVVLGLYQVLWQRRTRQ